MRKKFDISRCHKMKLNKLKYFGMFQDIPFEVLRTIYFGLVKNSLLLTSFQFSIDKKKLFLKFNHTLNQSGIEYLPKGNIINYVGSHTGKDYKGIVKIMPTVLKLMKESPELINL